MAMMQVFLLFGVCSLCVLAAVPSGTSEVQSHVSGNTAAAGNPSTAAATAEQPVAAESSYGSYGRSGYNSYSPRQSSYSSYNSYAPKYESYSNEYSAPYVTGSCYGQYPGVTGNANYDCKSYSVCQADGRLDILYCPPYTRFNNYLGVCDWHFKVDSYCNPLYKEEYSYNSYDRPASYGYDSYSSKGSNYGSNSGSSYGSSNYGYEAPSYGSSYSSSYEPSRNYGGYGSSYEAPSYGHRSVYPSSKKY